ncbi:Hcy-binding domain-containing protein [Psidium guajava]|nr:Hcy-binding domain-containing protein [Psidium guajava]
MPSSGQIKVNPLENVVESPFQSITTIFTELCPSFSHRGNVKALLPLKRDRMDRQAEEVRDVDGDTSTRGGAVAVRYGGVVIRG